MTDLTPSTALAYTTLGFLREYPSLYFPDSPLDTYAAWVTRLSGAILELAIDDSGRETGRIYDVPRGSPAAIATVRGQSVESAAWSLLEITLDQGFVGDRHLSDTDLSLDDIADLLAVIFGPCPEPLPGPLPSPCDCLVRLGRAPAHANTCPVSPRYATGAGRAWRECAVSAAYLSAAEHQRDCVYHRAGIGEYGRSSFDDETTF
ncbi:hypothetical protein [Actinoplanes sp. NPDC051851]|uniref:hypothetical protein n=1 Tax=Actinoplanes sp. NPDC051851 TaxID=3154753 RepID=UPI00342F7404